MPEVNEFGQSVGDLVPGWSRRQRPAPVTLEGRYVTVHPLSVEHAGVLLRTLGGEHNKPLWTYRPTDPPATVDEMVTLIEDTLAEREWVTFVLTPAGDIPSGLTSFMRIDPGTGQVEVAAVLFARSLQRTRAATEAIHLLMRYAFDELGYRRFEWKCDSLNEPSQRAAQRLGFVYEGRFRNHMVTKGRNRDTDWFSVTDTEWPAVRAAHEKWLHPSNFGSDGCQRLSLSSLTAGLHGDESTGPTPS